jgi:hypothetical protein
VAKFIGRLEGKGEQEVIDEYKAIHEAALRKKRKKKTWEDHPAMKLSAHQWKLMGFLGKIDGKMFHTNPELCTRGSSVGMAGVATIHV